MTHDTSVCSGGAAVSMVSFSEVKVRSIVSFDRDGVVRAVSWIPSTNFGCAQFSVIGSCRWMEVSIVLTFDESPALADLPVDISSISSRFVNDSFREPSVTTDEQQDSAVRVRPFLIASSSIKSMALIRCVGIDLGDNLCGVRSIVYREPASEDLPSPEQKIM